MAALDAYRQAAATRALKSGECRQWVRFLPKPLATQLELILSWSRCLDTNFSAFWYQQQGGRVGRLPSKKLIWPIVLGLQVLNR